MSKSSLITTLKRLRLLLITLQLLSVSPVTGNDISVNKDNARQLMQNQPVQFLENKGQMTDMDGKPIPFVFFKASVPGVDMYITEKGITYMFIKAEEEHRKTRGEKLVFGRKEEDSKLIDWERINMTLKGASIKKENIITEGKSPDFSQYFFSHCPKGITDVHSYKKVTIKNVYPGIDWVFYNSNDKGFKYDFIVHQGADPNQIELTYSSLNPLTLDDNGSMNIRSSLGTLTENTPYSYIMETNREVRSKFKITHQQALTQNSEEYYQATVAFNISPFGGDREGATLIIDPQLYWSTFYGGSGSDGPESVTVDKYGNVLVTGYLINSSNFPVQTSGTFFQGTLNGTLDAFILKFTNTGNLLWATYYGGAGVSIEGGTSITSDNNGNIFLTGLTASTSFPCQPAGAGAFYQGTYGGGIDDAFILKFDNTGNLLWASYFGGTGHDVGMSIVADGNGNVFVTGWTNSPNTNFPLQNAGTFFQGNFAGGGAGFGGADVFILKFDNACNLLWSTYYGGSDDEKSNAITTDINGNIFVTGRTQSPDFPVQNAGTFNGTYGGNLDGFILKFDNLGNRLWATWYGGSDNDIPASIATDANGNVFIAGTTNSGPATFPLMNSGAFYQGALAGFDDAFISKFDNTGNLLWATYYGGSSVESIASNDNLAVDSCGAVFFSFGSAGNTPTQAPYDGGYFDISFNGQYDQFITQFSNTGSLIWATYLGGDGNDFRSPVAVDASGSLFIAGEWAMVTNSNTYPLKNPGGGASYDDVFNGEDDAFITKFNKILPSLAPVVMDASCGCNGTASVTATGGYAPYSYTWSNGNQTSGTNSSTNTVTGLCPGIYTATVYFSCDTLETTVTVGNIPGNLSVNNVQVNADVTCLEMGSATATASDGTQPYTFSWSSGGQTTATATGLTIGIHTVTVTDNNLCAYTTTVIIADNTTPPDVTTGTPLDLNCAVSSVTLSAGSSVNGVSYSWDGPGIISGGTSPSPSVNTGGIYTVTVTNPSNGCINTATVAVNMDTVSPNIAAGTPLILGCTSSMGIINVSSNTNGVTFNWAGPGIVSGEATSSPTVNMEGTYTVTITNPNNGCTNAATITVTNDTTEPQLITGDSLILECGSTSGNLSASSNTSGANFFWIGPGILSGETTSTPLVNTQGSYTVTVTNPLNGCSKTDSVRVGSNIEGGDIFVPNAFSPDNSGENELECVYGGCIQNISFEIYNRWGQRVFVTNDLKECWDGTYKGKALNSDIFVFYLQATLITGEITTRQGNISLIR